MQSTGSFIRFGDIVKTVIGILIYSNISLTILFLQSFNNHLLYLYHGKVLLVEFVIRLMKGCCIYLKI